MTPVFQKGLLGFAAVLGILFGSVTWASDSTCKVVDQSGSSEAYWCWNHDQEDTIRCYAEVEFENGSRTKIWGHTCHSSYSDCWWSGDGKVEPYCSN